jgi:hypothetical protein
VNYFYFENEQTARIFLDEINIVKTDAMKYFYNNKEPIGNPELRSGNVVIFEYGRR